MNMTKEQLFEAALALNGDDKKYVITVEDDKIITRVKWMDATFFAPGSITDEMKEFEYIVKVFDNGKYAELDKSVSTTKSVNGGGLNYKKKIFIGKQLSFDKSIGFGKNKETGETGIVNTTFNSEEYKSPVRSLLKDSGCKKKMGTLGKIFIGASIFAVVAIIALVILLTSVTNKKPISADEFESTAKSFGYMVGIDEQLEKDIDYVKNVRIAIDKKDDYQIDLYILSDSDHAKEIYASNKAYFEELADTDSSKSSSSLNSPNYANYSASTSKNYLYIARIDNTVLYAEVGIEDKAEVKKFVDEIGY